MEFKQIKYFDSLYPPKTHESEFKHLIPSLEHGLSTQLVGLPGSGKSNILRLLAYNKEARFHNFGDYEKFLHFVYLDCTEIKDRPLFEIVKFILLSISFSLGERQRFDDSKKINDLLKEGLVGEDELLLFQKLKEGINYLAHEKKLTINLLFDRFESILPNLTSQFFSNLKVLRNLAKYRFACVFSLNRPLYELIDQQLLTEYQDLISENIIYAPLRDDEWLNFRAAYIEKAARKTLPQETKEKAIDLTGGHSRLSKLSFEALITKEEEFDDLKDFILKRSTIQNALKEVWESLTPSEQIALKENVSFEEAQNNYKHLVNTQLVGKNGITIPIFEDFIKTIPVESNETLSYSEEKNEIFFGESEISDSLSPSEFRLLKYLILNKGKICTKDEIITAIWSDQKSYEGVTDQALDQIFYRLRKKVEKDPKNPHYIQTLKGTGYKLSE